MTRIAGGIADNVIPDTATAHVNFRYAPGRAPRRPRRCCASWCEPYGDARDHRQRAVGARSPSHNDLVQRLIATGDLAVEPKQAWTPVAEFAAAGVDAVNFGPGDPKYAHRRDEQVAVDALVRSYETLERFACG